MKPIPGFHYDFRYNQNYLLIIKEIFMLKIGPILLLSMSLSSVAMDNDLNLKLRRATHEPIINETEIRSLVAAKADVNHFEGHRSLLHWLAGYGKRTSCMLLLELGANPDTLDRDYREDGIGGHTINPTPLMSAIDHKLEAVCIRMIEMKANIHQKDNNDQTALYMACEENLFGVCKLLIEKKADVNVATKIELSTPLHYCAKYNNAPLCKLLLKNGADMSKQNRIKLKPLFVATSNQSDAVIMVMLDHILFPSKQGIKTFLCCLFRLKSNDPNLNELYRQSKILLAPWLLLAIAQTTQLSDAIKENDRGIEAWAFRQKGIPYPTNINEIIQYLIKKQLED